MLMPYNFPPITPSMQPKAPLYDSQNPHRSSPNQYLPQLDPSSLRTSLRFRRRGRNIHTGWRHGDRSGDHRSRFWNRGTGLPRRHARWRRRVLTRVLIPNTVDDDTTAGEHGGDLGGATGGLRGTDVADAQLAWRGFGVGVCCV